LTAANGSFKYKYGLFVVIDKAKPVVTVFKNGDYYSGDKTCLDNPPF
jgi:hypothetical protein